ncbi:MAG: 50S ribosomal protein L23 [Planctomycetota bacterium]
MLDPIHIIKKPIITEKSTDEASTPIKKGRREGQPLNRYTFEVAKQARKPEIKAAIQSLYGVRVEHVATQTRKGVSKRTRYGTIVSPQTKKAIVRLHPDDRIELF